MSDNYKTRIETVIVEVNGQAIDCVSFASVDQAEAYKRSVRAWAGQRGLCSRVFTRVMEVPRRERDSQDISAPGFALAM